jgi:HAD superfamily hydrolase (TIGR01509 family)
MSCAIFDVDGTLVDSNDAHADAWVDAFSEHGVAVDRALVRRCIGMGGDKLMPRVSGIEEDSDLGKRISSRRADVFRRQYLPRLRGFPHVPDLLQRLRQDGVTLSVASSAKKEELDPLLEIAGAADYFRARTSSDDAEDSKPDPDIVAAAFKKGKCEAATTIMVGDTPYDIEAALRAGIRIVGVRSGGWNDADLKGASEIFDDIADMLAHYDDRVRPLLEVAAA